MISQDMISDPHFNSVSLEAQNIFVRMLAVSDDCGVVPANIYRLNVIINTPARLSKRLDSILAEIASAGLGYVFEYNDERYFAFKPASFSDYQSYILKKSTKSEYLRIPKEDFEVLSKNFQELPRNSGRVEQSASSTVESRKQTAESKEAFGEFKNVLLSPEELSRLTERLGSESRRNRAIEILSAYKQSKGKTYKSDYATFTTWVIGELEKRESTKQKDSGPDMDRVVELADKRRAVINGLKSA